MSTIGIPYDPSRMTQPILDLFRGTGMTAPELMGQGPRYPQQQGLVGNVNGEYIPPMGQGPRYPQQQGLVGNVNGEYIPPTHWQTQPGVMSYPTEGQPPERVESAGGGQGQDGEPLPRRAGATGPFTAQRQAIRSGWEDWASNLSPGMAGSGLPPWLQFILSTQMGSLDTGLNRGFDPASNQTPGQYSGEISRLMPRSLNQPIGGVGQRENEWGTGFGGGDMQDWQVNPGGDMGPGYAPIGPMGATASIGYGGQDPTQYEQQNKLYPGTTSGPFGFGY